MGPALKPKATGLAVSIFLIGGHEKGQMASRLEHTTNFLLWVETSETTGLVLAAQGIIIPCILHSKNSNNIIFSVS